MGNSARLLGAVLAICAMGQGAMAQEPGACSFAPDLVDLSEEILLRRSELGGFAPPRFGAQAAYLLSHYSQLPDEDMLALLEYLAQGSRREAVRDAQDMAMALAVSLYGVEAGLTRYAATAAEGFAGAQWHTWRAVMQADGGDSFFRLMGEILNGPNPDPGVITTLQYSLAPYVTVLPDAELAEISGHAEAHGFPTSAIIVAAHMQDTALLETLQRRYANDERVGRFAERNGLDSSAAVWRSRAVPLGTPLSPEQRDLYDIVRADTLSGRGSLLSLFVNMTGETGPLAEVARRYLGAVAAGHIDPFSQPDAAILFQYDAMVGVLGRDRVLTVAAGFSLSGDSFHVPGGMAADTLGWLVMLRHLAPVMQGGPYPPRPALMPPDAPFEVYAPFVLALRDDPARAGARSEAEQRLGVELLWRAGRRDEALEYARAHMELNDLLALYRSLSIRMDAACDGVLSYPGQGLLLGGRNLYRFPIEPYNE